MEANVLVDSKDGKWKQECGRISLDFHTIGNDEPTSKFLRLFHEELSSDCNNDDEAKQVMAHFADPNVPLPMHCYPTVCLYCRRYSIVATFTGRLRYRTKEQGGFGHLGMLDVQLDVTQVANLEVTDILAVPKP